MHLIAPGTKPRAHFRQTRRKKSNAREHTTWTSRTIRHNNNTTHTYIHTKTYKCYGEVNDWNFTHGQTLRAPQRYLRRYVRSCSGERPVFLRLSPASYFLESGPNKRSSRLKLHTQNYYQKKVEPWTAVCVLWLVFEMEHVFFLWQPRASSSALAAASASAPASAYEEPAGKKRAVRPLQHNNIVVGSRAPPLQQRGNHGKKNKNNPAAFPVSLHWRRWQLFCLRLQHLANPPLWKGGEHRHGVWCLRAVGVSMELCVSTRQQCSLYTNSARFTAPFPADAPDMSWLVVLLIWKKIHSVIMYFILSFRDKQMIEYVGFPFHLIINYPRTI